VVLLLRDVVAIVSWSALTPTPMGGLFLAPGLAGPSIFLPLDMGVCLIELFSALTGLCRRHLCVPACLGVRNGMGRGHCGRACCVRHFVFVAWGHLSTVSGGGRVTGWGPVPGVSPSLRSVLLLLLPQCWSVVPYCALLAVALCLSSERVGVGCRRSWPERTAWSCGRASVDGTARIELVQLEWGNGWSRSPDRCNPGWCPQAVRLVVKPSYGAVVLSFVSQKGVSGCRCRPTDQDGVSVSYAFGWQSSEFSLSSGPASAGTPTIRSSGSRRAPASGRSSRAVVCGSLFLRNFCRRRRGRAGEFQTPVLIFFFLVLSHRVRGRRGELRIAPAPKRRRGHVQSLPSSSVRPSVGPRAEWCEVWPPSLAGFVALSPCYASKAAASPFPSLHPGRTGGMGPGPMRSPIPGRAGCAEGWVVTPCVGPADRAELPRPMQRAVSWLGFPCWSTPDHDFFLGSSLGVGWAGLAVLAVAREVAPTPRLVPTFACLHLPAPNRRAPPSPPPLLRPRGQARDSIP